MMNDGALELLEVPRFRNELAQIGARATLKALESESTVRWLYRSERVVRNLTAMGQAVFNATDEDSAAPVLVPATLAIAQAWEHLATLGERVHPSTALLNSALFYELAGYQANAACLARLAVDQSRRTIEPAFDGLVSAFLQRLFLRVTTLRAPLIELPRAELLTTDDEIERRASYAVTALALAEASSYFLTGEDDRIESAVEHLSLAKEGLAQVGDAVAFNAVVGL